MIALRTIHNKEFVILEGKEIPKDILKKLDVERLKSEKVIGESVVKTESKPSFKKESK